MTQSLSDSLPLCYKHGLVVNYKMEYGAHISADLVEKILEKYEPKIFPPDQSKPGRPVGFDPDRYLDLVSDMINADEVERALWMLDNLPGYYRDHVPERAMAMKKRLHEQLFTPVQYKGIYDNVNFDLDGLLRNWPSRAQLVATAVLAYNQIGITPNIMELAPGPFWLPVGLKYKGLKFTYEHLSLDTGDAPFDKPNGDEKNIFVAFELIEHLYNEMEIYQNYLKFKKSADQIYLSTPLYTFAGGMPDWENRALGHLRTYTPTELCTKAEKMFPGYRWEAFVDHVINLVGYKLAST